MSGRCQCQAATSAAIGASAVSQQRGKGTVEKEDRRSVALVEPVVTSRGQSRDVTPRASRDL